MPSPDDPSECIYTDSDLDDVNDLQYTDVTLFGIVAALWLFNMLLIAFWRRPQNQLITGVLYSIVGLIIFTRLVEVIKLQVFDPSMVIISAGIIATYGKIALGCCQLSAMFEIRGQLQEYMKRNKIALDLYETGS